MPIVGGTCAAMHLFDIDFGDPRVMLNHLKGFVSQEGLEGE